MRTLWLLPLLLLAPAVAAQGVHTVQVELSSFDFDPGTIRLRAGEPVVLRLVNRSGGGHNFVAPLFFAAASGVSGPVSNGGVELRGHQSAEVRLVPTRGTYRLRCTHTLHSTLGMRGRIVVE
jgi:plastocyanin